MVGVFANAENPLENNTFTFKFKFSKFHLIALYFRWSPPWKNFNIPWKLCMMFAEPSPKCQKTRLIKWKMIISSKTKWQKWAHNWVRTISHQFVDNATNVYSLTLQCFVHCSLEMLHLIEGTVGQFHVAGQHTDYIIPQELYQTTIKAFGHCETISMPSRSNCSYQNSKRNRNFR